MPKLPPQDLDHICRVTQELWEEARGCRFFFTGGTGFFGTWLVESFLEANRKFCLNAKALVLTRNPEAFLWKCPHLGAHKDLELLKGDVRSFEFPSGSFDYIVHAATDASAKQANEQPLEMLSTIVHGTERTLAFAAGCGARKLLLTSSGAVYGPQPPEISHIEETFLGGPDCLKSTSVYGEGKRAAELICALYSRQFEIKIARCFAFVGPYIPLDAHFAIGNFIGDAMKGRPIVVNGDGTPKRSYLYASELAIWLWTILFRAQSGRPYNVGSANAVTIADLADRVRRVVSPDIQVTISEATRPHQPIRQYVPSVRRAEEELGLRQNMPLEEAIKNTTAWYRAKISES